MRKLFFYFQAETQGPFLDFADLKTRPAHLAAFINYLLTNANPSSVVCFFFFNYLLCFNFLKQEQSQKILI